MRVLDPGHGYALTDLDAPSVTRLYFVKRTGDGYPGNVGAHPGPTSQEVIRALIDRTKYVDGQIADNWNRITIAHLRSALYALESRAAARHGLALRLSGVNIEAEPVCVECGHITCKHQERSP